MSIKKNIKLVCPS